MGFPLRPLAAFFAIFSINQVLADHNQKEISDVIVTAPAAGSVPERSQVSDEVIQSLRAATSDSASLLRGVPGLSFYGAGGVSSLPAIRGLADDRIRIKVDGMDLVSACGNHMNPPLSYIDPSAVDSIEVFAGVSPVSRGGDSIGGSIVVNTKSPEFAQTRGEYLGTGEVGAFYRSNGSGRGANLGGTLANDQISMRYSGAYAKAGNYHAAADFKAAGPAAPGRQWLSGDEVGSSSFETQNHNLDIAVKQGNQRIDLELGYQKIPYQGFPNQRMDMLDNTSTQVAVAHQAEFQWGGVASRIYREHTRHKMNFGDDKQFWYADAPGMPMETEGDNTGLTIDTDYSLSSKDSLKLGVEWQQYRLDDWWPPSGSGMMMSPNTFWNIRDGERDRYAFFSELETTINNHWAGVIGVRHETVAMDGGEAQGYSMMYSADQQSFNSKDHERTDHNWDFSAQARYVPSATADYALGAARKTRSPNLYERYTWSTVGMAMRMVNFAGDGNGYVGNIELEPEIANTLSFSASIHDPGTRHWQVKISPFYTAVDDYIDATPCTTMMCNSGNAIPGFRYLTFRNDDARLYGADISGFKHLASIAHLGDFTVRAVVNYVDGENRRTGDNLYNIMPLNGTLTMEHRAAHWTNSVEWQLVSAKDEISAVRNEVPTSGYGLLTLRTSFTWQQLRFDAGVENALDKDYDLPLGGAYLGQGMTMSPTGVAWGTAVPGTGRSLYIGASYQL